MGSSGAARDAYGARGKYAQAEALLSQALEIELRVLGPEHPALVTLYVAKTPFASLKQRSPRNSDGGDLPNEDVMPVAHRDFGSMAVSLSAYLCPIHRESDRSDNTGDNPVQGASDGPR